MITNGERDDRSQPSSYLDHLSCLVAALVLGMAPGRVLRST
ncbi:hypothetical protein [Kineosporia mesophila]|nr:hypothetical protein [Kineosporia mesophila]